MRKSDIAEFKQNQHIADLIAEFEEKLKKRENDPFDFSFEDITAQTETHIIDVGLVGIEIVRHYLDAFEETGTRVDLYAKYGDEWVRCFSRKIDWTTIQFGVWDTLAAYREKLERQARNEKKRKYRKGDPVNSVNELLDQEFVYWHDKIYARGWFLSWPLRMAYEAVKRGEIYKAIRKDEADV